MYNENKICFVICTNNRQFLDECLLYIDMLIIPEGYEIEILTVEGAKCMTAGYNEGMAASDAKYKIYMHHDVFILNKHMLFEMLNIFQSDENIGMIGLVGAVELATDGVMWHLDRCGNMYRLADINEMIARPIEIIKDRIQEVEVVDGMFMATQYDIPWREDILNGWDFYDVSQCLEFRRAGYKVVVPPQEEAWINHVCGAPSFWRYNHYREIVVKEYPEFTKDKNRLRIYFMRSNEIGLLGLPYCLNELGHEVSLSEPIPIAAHGESAVELIEESLEEGNYDLVMSYDFIALVATACQNMGVKYWAWVYDSPLLNLYLEEAKLSNLYVSVFDRKQYERLQEVGLKNLFYLPLATEVDYFGHLDVTEEDERKYRTDIAFVGRLYDSHDMYALFDGECEELHREAEAIIKDSFCVWDGKDYLFDRASDDLIEFLVSKEKNAAWDIYSISKRYYCETMFLARKKNEEERIHILNTLARKYKVNLYSDDGAKTRLERVKICPWVDYWQEMPKVFYLSKINLNITSRSIESGVPQRIWDIMAVGGFCLTNYQPELEEYFVIGKDLEVFHNMKELEEKVAYYLTHEKERIRIAMNGYKKVRENHSYEKRVAPVLEELFGDMMRN